MSYNGMEGIDATSDVNADTMLRGGKKFICRYIGPGAGLGGSWKHTDKKSVDWYIKKGVHVVFIAEGTGSRSSTDTYAEGQRDARSANGAVKALGRPNAPIYFCIDYDAPPSAQAGINAYLKGAGSVVGKGRVGVYASYYVVDRCRKAGVATWFWQTYAWSGSMRDKNAHILQYKNHVGFAGTTVDYDKILPGGANGFGCACHPAHGSEEDDLPSAKEVVDELLHRDVFHYPWKTKKDNPTWNFQSMMESIWQYAYAGHPDFIWGADVIPVPNPDGTPRNPKNPEWQAKNSLGAVLQNLYSLHDKVSRLEKKVDAGETVNLTTEQLAALQAAIMAAVKDAPQGATPGEIASAVLTELSAATIHLSGQVA